MIEEVQNSEKDVVIFGKDNCPHCTTAMKTCVKKQLTFDYFKLGEDYDQDKVYELIEKTGQRSFPFVFSGIFIGGAKELHQHIKGL